MQELRYNEVLVRLVYLTNSPITQAELGRVIGLDRSASNKRYQRNSSLSSDEVKKIEEYFKVELSTKSTLGDCLSIPIRGDVKASMGYGATVYTDEATGTYSISQKLISDMGAAQKNLEMIFAQGDSMMPTITSGDSLIIDISKKEIYDGKIYCVRIDGQLYAKRLQKIPPSVVNVLSDNPQYESFKIDFSKQIDFDFQVIGEVRWSGRVFS